jgi:hypothetical protein
MVSVTGDSVSCSSWRGSLSIHTDDPVDTSPDDNVAAMAEEARQPPSPSAVPPARPRRRLLCLTTVDSRVMPNYPPNNPPKQIIRRIFETKRRLLPKLAKSLAERKASRRYDWGDISPEH